MNASPIRAPARRMWAVAALADLTVLAIAASLVAPLAADAATDFPDGASTPSADDLRKHLADRVFDVQTAGGETWRLEYKANGYFYVNTSRNFNGSGDWRAEDGRVCSALRGNATSCNGVRMHDGALLLKRDNGEVIRLVAR